MNIRILLGVLMLFLISCNHKQQTGSGKLSAGNIAPDTVVGSRNVIGEIGGSAYLKRATGYFLIIGKDTSDNICSVTEFKDGGRVWIELNVSLRQKKITYRQRLEAVRIILPKAATDFNFDSLKGIDFGQLISNGDLAVDIAKQYYAKFGTGRDIENYSTVAAFLKESKLGTDVNTLFKPYSLFVDKVYMEKLFFVPRDALYWAIKVETDTADIPPRIVDCSVGVGLIKK